MLSDFIGIRVNRAKTSGMVNITSCVIFFERCGIHPDLHSFPTRRSSDLVDVKLGHPPPSTRDPLRAARATRSEEHTSELQSRGHLVCRLLLEKKKSIILIKLIMVILGTVRHPRRFKIVVIVI